MFGTRNFLQTFIMTFLTFILLLNVIYAFDLTRTLGIPVVYNTPIGIDYTQSFFGVSDLINSFESFFSYNTFLGDIQYVLKEWSKIMSSLSIDNIFKGFIISQGVSVEVADAVVTDLVQALGRIFTLLFSLFNLLVNLPYVLSAIIYFLIFAFYVIIVIFTFISYLFYLMSGQFVSPLSNTQFPDVDDVIDVVVPMASSLRILIV